MFSCFQFLYLRLTLLCLNHIYSFNTLWLHFSFFSHHSDLSFFSLFFCSLSLFFSSGSNGCSAVNLWSMLKGAWNLHWLSHLLSARPHSSCEWHTHKLLHAPFYRHVPALLLFTETSCRNAHSKWVLISDTVSPIHLKWPSKQLVCIMPWLVP